MKWTTDMTGAALRALQAWVIMVGVGLLLPTGVCAAASLSPVTEEGAIQLVEHGGVGLTALVILAVLVPTVGSSAWLVRSIVKMFGAQLQAAQAEREVMMVAEERERDLRWKAIQDIGATQTSALVEQSRNLRRVCDILERRPCLADQQLLAERERD